MNSSQSKPNYESNLEVSSRWGHSKIVSYLLSLPPIKILREEAKRLAKSTLNISFDMGALTFKVVPAFTIEEIKRAKSCSSSPEITKMLKLYMKNKFSSSSRCFCIC